jgi:hypothetical protein
MAKELDLSRNSPL